MLRSLEKLSRRQREHTPAPFARFLLDRVMRTFGVDMVAVLWVQRDSVYNRFPEADCWDVVRDATRYSGPGPIIAHPPCGPWGKYHNRCHQDPSHGIRAMDLVHQFGGVVEQPVGSRLFYEHGGRALVQTVNQSDFGHPCLKPTMLYWFVPDRPLPFLPRMPETLASALSRSPS